MARYSEEQQDQDWQNTQSKLLPTQCGGLPGRSTELPAQMARAFVERCRTKKAHRAILSVDAKASFHAALRQILLPIQEGPDKLAKVIESLNLPDSAVKALTKKLKDKPEMQKTDLGDHFILMLTELFSDTWFTVPHDKRAHQTLRGTKPGDPFGDIAFTYLFGRVMKSISNKLEQQGLKVELTPANQAIEQDNTQAHIKLSICR